jgi:quinol monooxygenase YgiN
MNKGRRVLGSEVEGQNGGVTSPPPARKAPVAVVVAVISVEALPGKRKELMQTLSALMRPTRESRGCLDCRLYEDMETRWALCMVTEWRSEEDFDRFRASDTGRVLLGAVQALCEGARLTLSRLASREKAEISGSGSRP